MHELLKKTFLIHTKNEKGIALLMTTFIIALITILVMELVSKSHLDQRMSRSYVEGIQGHYILKSTLGLARTLISLPKLQTEQVSIKEDWLGDPWALIAAAPSLPVSGFSGEPRVRITIVDEDGKINVNSVVSNNSNNPFGNNQNNSSLTSSENFWKNSLRELFAQLGLRGESYDEELNRTLGNVAFSPSQQVAVIHDWIDSNSNSHNDTSFDGEGIESSASKEWFYNQQLSKLDQLLLVPGITLERLQSIAPFVRASQSFSSSSGKINVNTAPLQVLLAIGFPESQAIELVEQRVNLPITQEILNTLVTGDAQLKRFTKVRSNEFSIYSKVELPNETRWMKAVVAVQGSLNSRKTIIRNIEFY